jgi:tripartite-type tricarboxylate transporter receptor subunit TctC
MLKLLGGVNLLHVPYKSNVDAIPDLLAGNVQMMFESIVFPYVKAGKLKLIAILDETRFEDFPDVPTMKEAGFPDYDIPLWYALYSPAGVPRPILERLNREIVAIVSDKEFSEGMRQRSFRARVYSLEAIQEKLNRQREMYQSLLRRANIKLEGN